MHQPINIIKVILISLCLSLVACGGTLSKKNGSEEAKAIITVTIEPQRYFTEAIAGDKFTVVSMVPKGMSPETYDPIPQQLVSLGNSKAYFRIGYIGFEQIWMDRLMNNAPHLQIFNTSKGIDLISNSEEAQHEHKGHAQDGHSHAVEPHVWTSAINALILAKNTYQALCTIDKANETYYLMRYDSLCQHIQQTDSIIRRKLSDQESSKAFMIYHPALSYFARDYGLTQISIEEEGKEPSPAHLKDLIDLCKMQKVKVIFVQPEFDKRNAETIAQQTNTKVVPINPLSYDWSTEILNIAEALYRTK